MQNERAFLFDMNGTMINDMAFHVRGWHKLLTELGVSITLKEMQLQCYGKNEELLERMLPGRFSDEEKQAMIMTKENIYQQEFRPHMQLISGLHEFLEKAKSAGIKMAIGSAAIMYNINYILDGLNIRHYFDAIVSADHVTISKPDPETFTKAADLLGVPYEYCIVFEDAAKGVEAALNAGMKSVVIKGFHEPEEFDYLPNIIAMVDDYNDPVLNGLF